MDLSVEPAFLSRSQGTLFMVFITKGQSPSPDLEDLSTRCPTPVEIDGQSDDGASSSNSTCQQPQAQARQGPIMAAKAASSDNGPGVMQAPVQDMAPLWALHVDITERLLRQNVRKYGEHSKQVPQQRVPGGGEGKFQSSGFR